MSVAGFGGFVIFAVEHDVLSRITVKRVLMRLRLLKAADELRFRFGIALSRVSMLFALGLAADKFRLRHGITLIRVRVAFALRQPANRLSALAHGITAVSVLMRGGLRLLKLANKHALLRVALLRVRMLRNFRQRADKRAAVIVAFSRVRMYHEVGITACQLAIRAVTPAGMFMQIQLAIQCPGTVLQGDRRHDHKGHRHHQRQHREQSRSPVPAPELPALPDILTEFISPVLPYHGKPPFPILFNRTQCIQRPESEYQLPDNLLLGHAADLAAS